MMTLDHVVAELTRLATQSTPNSPDDIESLHECRTAVQYYADGFKGTLLATVQMRQHQKTFFKACRQGLVDQANKSLKASQDAEKLADRLNGFWLDELLPKPPTQAELF